MVEPGNTPDIHEIYRLVRDNNQMLHSMKRRAFWGGIFKMLIYLAMFLVPIWLYFIYLAPVVQRMNDTLSSVSGKKIQLEGQFGDLAKMFEQFKDRFTGGSASSTKSQ